MFAVDFEGARQPDGNLRDADEMLDVAFENVRVERVLINVLKFYAAKLFQQFLPLLNDCRRVIVIFIARNFDAVLHRVADGIVHLELEFAEIFRLETDFDFVFTFWQRGQLGLHNQRHSQWKGQRRGAGNLQRLQRASVREYEFDGVERRFVAVNGDFADADQIHIAQTIFDRELYAVGGIFQTP